MERAYLLRCDTARGVEEVQNFLTLREAKRAARAWMRQHVPGWTDLWWYWVAHDGGFGWLVESTYGVRPAAVTIVRINLAAKTRVNPWEARP